MPAGISYIGDLTIVEDGGEITSQSVGDKALKSTAADDSSLEVNSTSGKMAIKDSGSSRANGVQRAQMSAGAGFWLRGTLTASDAAGGIFSVENTYGAELIVIRLIVQSTGTSGACTVDVGVAVNGTTSSDDLIDGLDVEAVGTFDNITDPGTNGAALAAWKSGEFVNASMATGAAAGLGGNYAIQAVTIAS